jgi:hypothetical protein
MKWKTLTEAGEQIYERLALFRVRNLCLEPGAERGDKELHLRVRAIGD